jgi:hypothetical protein
MNLKKNGWSGWKMCWKHLAHFQDSLKICCFFDASPLHGFQARSSWHGSTGSTGRRSPPAPGQSGRGRDEAREGWLDGRTETNQQYPTHGVVEDVVEDVILISPWVGTLGTNDFLGYNFMGIHTVYSKQVWIGGFLNRWDHDPKELSVQADRLGRFTSGRVYFRARLMSCSWRVWVDKPWLVSQGQPTKSD